MSSVNVFCIEVSNSNMEKIRAAQTSGDYSVLAQLADVVYQGEASSTVADVLAHIQAANPLEEVSQQTEAKKVNLFAIRPKKAEESIALLDAKTQLSYLASDEFVCFNGEDESSASVVILYSADAEFGVDGQTCCLIAMCAACCACLIGVLCCCCNKGDNNNNNNNN
ncbi:hypothetical protein AGDE_12565 [Angomonas deanei]|uniref:Uncharacterized protein n=1 Tax=Angomonas deanei TaxID=59799 RepID=A0A7G2CEU7_9TRYP|nr:hypothetical protein AGDE_12565 [Angomonas deanei]CAD2217213.1 hypothetical protein, conserved [Angomonas deanei]|eukprot:EPY24027.1 hypothetical protein AGDE_12565 [Angomonas deanei]